MAVNKSALLSNSIAKLSSLIRERRKLDKEIRRVQAQLTLAHWRSSGSAGATLSQSGPPGFTDAIRQVLCHYPTWLSPTSIRDLLPMVGFDTEGYQEPLGSIHSILRRLARTGEVSCVARPEIGRAYRWAAAQPDAHRQLAAARQDENAVSPAACFKTAISP